MRQQIQITIELDGEEKDAISILVSPDIRKNTEAIKRIHKHLVSPINSRLLKLREEVKECLTQQK